MTSSLAFNEVAQALAAGGSSVHAAEAHGCLCGALCVRSGYRVRRLARRDASGARSRLPDRDGPLADLFEQTLRCSRRRDMEFEPLLPDDDVALDERVDALSAWCQGFLYGFGTAATVPQVGALPARSTEVLATSPRSRAADRSASNRWRSRKTPTRSSSSSSASACSSSTTSCETRTPPEAPRSHHSSLSTYMTVRKDEFVRRRRQLMRMMGKGGIAILPTAVGEAAQQRRALLLPARQRFPLSHRLRRARGGRGAGARPRRRRSTSCSSAIATRPARPGTAGAPDPRARRATTAPTMRFRSATSTTSCPA